MGAGASTQIPQQFSDIDNFSKRAAVSKELANHILNIYFERADFNDVLSITSISSCPRYVFTTARALGELFQTIQVDPRLGKNGEILFAPISKLSPGLISDKKEGTQELAVRTRDRNRMCMDVAYMYVRIFQMYAALSLTILDADPVRKRFAYGQSSYSQQGYQGYQGPARAVGFGGGVDVQTGGKLEQKMAERLSRTPFVPLIPFFKKRSENTIQLIDDTRTTSAGSFIIQINDSQREKYSMTYKGVYKKKTDVRVPFEIKMEYTNSDKSEIILYLDNNETQEFYNTFGDEWVFKYDNVESENPEKFIKKIHTYFLENKSYDNTSRRSTSSGLRPSTTSSGIALPSGKSAFDSFDQIKKIYEDHKKGAPFPKAYCIARAMTLMNPLFPTEVAPGGSYYSQICKSTFDFETPGADYMPRGGRQPKANIYLRSLVSLYFDDYAIKGNDIEFTQTALGHSQLREGSARLAKLYNITTNPESFIESTQQFKSFSMCGKDIMLQFKDERIRKKIFDEVIMKMIKLQEEHTKRVNILLNRMFKIKIDPRDGKPTMQFGDELKVAGKQSINKFCEEVRNVLLNYYLASEYLYIYGVNMIKNNPSATGPI